MHISYLSHTEGVDNSHERENILCISMKVNTDRWHQLAVDEKRTSYRKAENNCTGSTTHYTTRQMHILKQNDYYKAQVLIIAVCISLHVVEIQLEIIYIIYHMNI